MPEIHTATLEGAIVAGRQRLVAELRALGAEWPGGVYAESRGIADDFDALEYVASTANAFSVFVVAEDPEIEFDAGKADVRHYRPSYLLLFVQKFTEGHGEDQFLTRLERAVLRLAGMFSVTLTTATADVEFRVRSIESVAVFANLTLPNGAAVGHSSTKRVTLEVEACAT